MYDIRNKVLSALQHLCPEDCRGNDEVSYKKAAAGINSNRQQSSVWL